MRSCDVVPRALNMSELLISCSNRRQPLQVQTAKVFVGSRGSASPPRRPVTHGGGGLGRVRNSPVGDTQIRDEIWDNPLLRVSLEIVHVIYLVLWSPERESNSRPTHYECVALPTELSGRALCAASDVIGPPRTTRPPLAKTPGESGQNSTHSVWTMRAPSAPSTTRRTGPGASSSNTNRPRRSVETEYTASAPTSSTVVSVGGTS